MKTLQEIKDEYAKEQGHGDWVVLQSDCYGKSEYMEAHMDEICIRAQKIALGTHVIYNFPYNVEIWKWWETQKFQKEQGEQGHTMIYEMDLPKILKSFFTHFNQ